MVSTVFVFVFCVLWRGVNVCLYQVHGRVRVRHETERGAPGDRYGRNSNGDGDVPSGDGLSDGRSACPVGVPRSHQWYVLFFFHLFLVFLYQINPFAQTGGQRIRAYKTSTHRPFVNCTPRVAITQHTIISIYIYIHVDLSRCACRVQEMTTTPDAD